jgi:hypothetical protein
VWLVSDDGATRTRLIRVWGADPEKAEEYAQTYQNHFRDQMRLMFGTVPQTDPEATAAR